MMKLGKRDYKHDERTLQLERFLAIPPTIEVPQTFDFDGHRTKFKTDDAWGNHDYGCCVLAARANQFLRLERIETRRNVPIAAQMVVDKYKERTGCQSPGDQNDTGLVMLDEFNDWRAGWKLPVYHGGRNYKIEAYGFLKASDRDQLRSAIYLLDGIQLGIWLPWTARTQLDANQPWDVVPNGGQDAEPGTWGGHAVYCKRYDAGGVYCITWDQEVYMTDAFIAKYADEAWAVVDSLNAHSRYLDTDKMKQYLRDIGASHVT